MRRRRNKRPGLTTLAAKERWPISESKSLFVQLVLSRQAPMRPSRAANLSAGRRAMRCTASISIPRNVST